MFRGTFYKNAKDRVWQCSLLMSGVSTSPTVLCSSCTNTRLMASANILNNHNHVGENIVRGYCILQSRVGIPFDPYSGKQSEVHQHIHNHMPGLMAFLSTSSSQYRPKSSIINDIKSEIQDFTGGSVDLLKVILGISVALLNFKNLGFVAEYLICNCI